MSCRLHLSGVTAGYNCTSVLQNFSLEAKPGELLALLGPSGCGKTTVLKVIAGLVEVSSGEVQFDGTPVNSLPPERRGAAMVFQKPLLFPHLNVEENIGFSLKMKKTTAVEIERRVQAALVEVKLEGYGKRRPSQLSGGQEQRVSVARALVSDPKLLLLDEPFSALDENLRQEMRLLLKSIHRRLGVTTIFVTHDQNEAAGIAHRIAFMLRGKVEQLGEPRDFFTAPASLASARFFGWQVLGTSVFRPESVRLSAGGSSVVESSTDLGLRVRSSVRLQTGELVDAEHGPPAFQEGDCVTVEIPPSAMRAVKE